MNYLIDGHNLIGQLPDISLDDPHDEAKLVQKLRGFSARTGNACTVVFDHGIPGGVSSLSTSKVKVIFAAAHHTSADEIMLNRIHTENNPNQLLVISSDREVLFAAEFRRIQTLTSHEFVPILNRPSMRKKFDTRGEASEIYISPKEVDEWLKIFKKKKK